MEIKFRKNNSAKELIKEKVLGRCAVLLNKIRMIFVYKEENNRKAENTHHDYLRKISFDSSGVIDYQSGYFITRGKEKFKIFRLDFWEPNGLESFIDDQNHRGLIQIQDILVKEYAVLFPQEHKYNLQNAIDFYTFCLNNEEIDSRRMVLEDNLRLMHIFNESKYVSVVMFIQGEDVDKFRKIASMICNVSEYKKREAAELLDMLNNELV